MILGIHHVAILTYDIEKALAHYCEFFDCDETKVVTVHDPEQNVNLKTAMLKIGPSGNTALQLFDPLME